MAFVTHKHSTCMYTPQEEEVRGVPLLVYVNKQDLPNAHTASQVATELELEDLGAHAWHAQGCVVSMHAMIQTAMHKDWVLCAVHIVNHTYILMRMAY